MRRRSAPESDAPERLVDAALSTYGRLDVLVNNVGAGSARSGFLNVDDAEWARVFDMTFFSAVRTSRAALPARPDNGGAIVNISSINARLRSPWWSTTPQPRRRCPTPLPVTELDRYGQPIIARQPLPRFTTFGLR
ncbi:SDR family NAD(P)-dependent oxidoreductase [Micromonospora taraxaci]|uniref:SDR family NAD(P)-dependent oxidoreductase n=1 Tax=Micromonospora taraxaci TaxID=1316803 RepID=UPI00340EAA36